HTRFSRDWSSDVCSSDLQGYVRACGGRLLPHDESVLCRAPAEDDGADPVTDRPHLGAPGEGPVEVDDAPGVHVEQLRDELGPGDLPALPGPGGRGEGEPAQRGLVPARVLDPVVVDHLAGDLVAHAVDHPGAVDLLVRLRDVGVGAEQEVDGGAVADAGGGEGAGQGDLLLVGGLLPFGAPVHGDDDHVGSRRAGGARVGEDAGLVDQVDGPALAGGHGDDVGVVVVGEVGDRGGARAQHGDRAGLLFGAGRPGVPHARAVEGVQGAADAFGAVVEGVVGGGGAAVVAGGGQAAGDLGRRLEGGVAAVVAVLAVDGLHVTQRQVGAGDDGADPGEHGAEVVAG